jgi:hypothetical protein
MRVSDAARPFCKNDPDPELVTKASNNNEINDNTNFA